MAAPGGSAPGAGGSAPGAEGSAPGASSPFPLLPFPLDLTADFPFSNFTSGVSLKIISNPGNSSYINSSAPELEVEVVLVAPGSAAGSAEPVAAGSAVAPEASVDPEPEASVDPVELDELSAATKKEKIKYIVGITFYTKAKYLGLEEVLEL